MLPYAIEKKTHILLQYSIDKSKVCSVHEIKANVYRVQHLLTEASKCTQIAHLFSQLPYLNKDFFLHEGLEK